MVFFIFPVASANSNLVKHYQQNHLSSPDLSNINLAVKCIKFRGAFGTLSNIYDGAFCNNKNLSLFSEAATRVALYKVFFTGKHHRKNSIPGSLF